MKFRPLHDRVVVRRVEAEEGCAATGPTHGLLSMTEGRRGAWLRLPRKERQGQRLAMYHPLDALFDFQRALETRMESDWLRGATAGTGAFPPINVFQQGDNLVAIIELAGINKSELEIQAKDNIIRISGKKNFAYPEKVSLHRCERLTGTFDRTLTLPILIDAERVKAEYRDGVLALFIPRAESDKPRSISIN
jgi:HSP20 family protein